ncbi:MAG: cofactor-independent phosphoglycerate mutase [Candidatus Margulisbacteria bacterium]|nr:cofactor-independent phosphoglycerate mutase [Candidatus Margulisiibacteriota bacterium]MBU1021718.1 cofactor-independent phosphoglycerate mutase [Candidatus Margulisiibacteriota bacterium]MBU1729464.1 cofactor-independent phosphoglycerate mutase [Candidatus Margulisiibacteriota bacterium]MBU1955435.1 cofactor-independent phosphoglycerate mutase [Candidatus Margulisiibacteriota bacterium]
MKYVVLIGDGMTDEPLSELNGKTPLEVANIPNMDFIAKSGIGGYVRTVPQGFIPGSDVANMSVFGYDPKKYYTGRGPLEATSLGVELKKDEVAFRCNLVTVKDGVMDDFTAGHISTDEAKVIIEDLNANFGNNDIRFIPGLSYRHLVVIKNGPEKAECTAPHDITGKKINLYLSRGKGEELLNNLMKESVIFLARHPVNKKRVAEGKKPATMIWLWGQGRRPAFPLFQKVYKKTGAVITAVHLLKGIGKNVGFEVINVPGATGFIDTNYEGKASAAIEALKNVDVVFLHVESPDECGHMGNLKLKIKAIEDFDQRVVGNVLQGLKQFGEFGVMVLPDHPTPIAKKTHTADPVPFAIYKSKLEGKRPLPVESEVSAYNEKAVSASELFVNKGEDLLRLFFEI